MTEPILLKPGYGPGHADDCAWTTKKWTCTCGHGDYVADIDIVATRVVADCVGDALDFGHLDWSDYPDLPEFVWEDVTHCARPTTEDTTEYEAAYARLSSLAQNL
jgi:hypothetical protein